MINIDYVNGTVEDFTVVLSNRNLEYKGQILNIDDFIYHPHMNVADEISFSVYKEIDGVEERLWNDIADLRVVWVKEANTFFEINVSLSETTNTIKKVIGISLGEAETSQTLIRNTEINTEEDIARDDYEVTVFYNPDNTNGSLLHRVLSVMPHYSIKHVDKSLWNIQRTFSIDETSVYDFLTGECAEEIGCLFQFDSTDRSISVYDLCTVCNDCGYRGEYLDICPKCGSENLYSYGEDTSIFVSVDNLTDEINFETDVDSIKNCMRLKSGDEVMDAAIIACNPNGSQYLYYFSEEQKADMPEDLRNNLTSYDALVESYSEEYQLLSQQLYECIDDILYYQSGMMPTVEIPEVNATTEAAKLTEKNLSPLGLSVVSSYTSTATVNSALKNFAKVFVKSGFVKVEIDSGNFTYDNINENGVGYGTWVGRFKITNYSDEEDVAYSDELTIVVNDDYETFLEQKILKNISSNNTDDDSVYDVLRIDNLDKFKEALTLYSYNRLESFADAIQGVINILIEENQGQSNSTYYSQMYTPYYNKLQACQAEMNVRANTITGLKEQQSNIIKRQTEIQKALNMRDYLGEELYKLFCTYRREDTYQNDNFISDGLSNEEIFEKAKEFIELAKREIVKSGEHQHSITANLYNLLIMKEFEPIKDKFDLGNWIRIKIDDEVYRLRLVSYEIKGKSMSNINTEFSNLTKTASGVNDVRSILSKAQSMATSYSYVSKQAEQGKKAQDAILNVGKEGINSAHMNIMNSPEQETVFGKYGILCRTKDETGEYSPEQSRITNNIWAFTDDAWKSVTLGLGKHDYYYYDDNDILKKETGYGLSSRFVSAGNICGSQIIGGEIYSYNYSSTSGTYINLNDGSFSFAGGRLIYNTDENTLNMRGFLSSDMKTIVGETIYDTSYTIAGCHGIMYFNDNVVYKYGTATANGTSLLDTGIIHVTNMGYLGFGITNDSGGASMRYIVNNGINPYSCTERHIFNGTTRFLNSTYCCEIQMTPTGTSIDESQYVSLYNSEYDGTRSICCSGGLYVFGDITCSGTKHRAVDTEHYGKIGMNAFETPEPYFADIGSGTISEMGSTTIYIDPIFAETIDMNSEYQVFITSSSSQVYVIKQYDSFTVHGEVGATFDWMICSKQKDYSAVRMSQINVGEKPKDEGEIEW